MLKINNLKKSFKDTLIFNNLNLEINNSGIHVITGKSGCGKSTLLNIIMGYEKIDSGEVIIDTKPIMIFQNYELFDNLTVKDNILLGQSDDKLNNYLIDKLDMHEYLDHKVNELSLGQRQRVGIIRTLSNASSLILCDEPTESLDISNKIIVMDLLKEISKNSIVILVTHDLKLAEEYGDYFYVLENQDLKLVKQANNKSCINKTENHFKKENTINIYNKLFFRKNFRFYILHCILLLILSLLVVLSIKWFSIPNTTNTLNANHLYLEYQNISLNDALNYLELKDNKYRVSYKFQSIYLDNRYHYIDILPHPYEDEGVYINQNAKDIFKNNKIGDEINLNYYVNNKEQTYTTKIKEYIVEDDTKTPIVYYGYEEFIDYLKTQKVDDSDEYKKMIDSAEYVDISIDYEDLKTVFSKNNNDNISLTSPLYQERVQFIQDSSIYKMIYSIFEIILFFAIMIMHIIYLNNNTNKNIDAFAILISQGHKLDILKNIFIKNIISMNLLGVLLTLVITIAISYFMKVNLILPILLLISYLVVSIIIILIFSERIKVDKMNQSLKNRLD